MSRGARGARIPGARLGARWRPVSGFHWDWHSPGRSSRPADRHRLTVLATLLGSCVVRPWLGLDLIRLTRIRRSLRSLSFSFSSCVERRCWSSSISCSIFSPSGALHCPPSQPASLGLGVFYSAYTTEIYRAGIENLPAGQWEAALSSACRYGGSGSGSCCRNRSGPVLPMLGNQVIGMFKESSLLSTITVMELLAQGKISARSIFAMLSR